VVGCKRTELTVRIQEANRDFVLFIISSLIQKFIKIEKTIITYNFSVFNALQLSKSVFKTAWIQEEKFNETTKKNGSTETDIVLCKTMNLMKLKYFSQQILQILCFSFHELPILLGIIPCASYRVQQCLHMNKFSFWIGYYLNCWKRRKSARKNETSIGGQCCNNFKDQKGIIA
jgi:hypothetical protein